MSRVWGLTAAELGVEEEDPLGGPQLGMSGDRVLLAARLWHAGKTQFLVASGCSRDEVAAYRTLQARFGWRRMGLISSAWHLPRAMGLAGRAGLPVTPLGADWRGRRHPLQVRTLVPQAEGFIYVHWACWEHLGRWVGR